MHAITSLTLENFRNYRSLSLTLSPQPVVLRGKNGAGKTNILEAISLLTVGRGFRGARLREMDALHLPCVMPAKAGIQLEEITGDADASRWMPAYAGMTTNNVGKTLPWVVAATIATGEESCFIGTGRDGESAAEKRIIKINGEKIRGQAALANHACIQWLTPSMDQVFVAGGTARRKLLDRMVYGLTPEHAARVAAYESAMRERNRLLGDQRMADPHWLSVLEEQMAEHAVAITIARQDFLARLQQQLAAELAQFPRALVGLSGLMEDWLGQGDSALEVEKQFAARLALARGADAARGRATLGPQRSEFTVIHHAKNMPAEQCSTGEQKALLLALVLGAARARANWCGVAPILLLDEVIAHLDVDKRAALFDLIRRMGIQAWMTGTDAADFKGLEGFSTTLEIDGGRVRM